VSRLSTICGVAIAGLILWGSGAAAQTDLPPSPAPAATPILGGGLAPGQDRLQPSKDRIAAAPPSYIRRDHWDCADFSRKSDATWSATRAVAFPAPEGVLKVDQGSIYRIGQFYGGFDLAAMLEHDCPKG